MSWLDRILFRGKKGSGQWRPVQESKGDVAVGDGAVLNVSSNSYRSLIEAAVSDAERIASDITDTAKSGANAEAARVLAQARLEAETLKAKAEASAREEAQNIISEAEETAAGIEIEAKKRAVQFLVQQSQLIEKEIAREYRLALAKLSANLQSLSSDSDKMNLQLKRKMAMLAANKSLSLNAAKTALLSEAPTLSLETPAEKTKKLTSGVETKSSRSVTGRQQAAGNKGKKQSGKKLPPAVEIPEPELQTPTADLNLEEATPATTIEPPVSVAEEPAVPTAEVKTVEQKPIKAPSSTDESPKKLRKFFSFSFSFTGKKEKPDIVAVKKEPEPAVVKAGPEPAAAAAPPAAPEEMLEPTAAPVATVPAEIPPEETVAPAKVEPAQPGISRQITTEAPTLIDVDTQLQYSGEVELMVVPPVDLKLVTQLYNYLQTIQELKVLYTRGSWDQGTTIVVVLEKPFALVKSITGIPNVSVSIGVLEKDAAAGGKTISLLRRKDRTAKRLGLILKEAVVAPKA